MSTTEQNKKTITSMENIEEANVIEEKTTSSENSNGTIKKEEIQGSKEVDMNNISEKKEQKTVINFMDDKSVNNFIQQETKLAEPLAKSPDERLNNKTIEELREQVKREENEAGAKMTTKDFQELAHGIIFVIDLIISSILKLFAKDTSDSAYSLSAPKRKEVEYMLTMILVKHQAKFKIEILFLILIIGCYAGPVMAARDNRKKAKASEVKVVKSEQQVKQNTSQNYNNETVIEKKEEVENGKPNLGVKLGRGRGKPGKS